MSDNHPPSPDDPTRQSGSETTVDQAQPYRTPANVSESTPKAGVAKSPWLWFGVLALTGAAAVGAFLFLASPVRDFNMNRRPADEYFEDFGASRMPPPEDEEVVMQPIAPETSAVQDATPIDPNLPVVP